MIYLFNIDFLNELYYKYKYRKINKLLVFLDYDKVFYSRDRVVISIQNDIEKYYEWGETNRNLIRIRNITDITIILNDLKYLLNNQYRLEKFKRILE